MARPSLMAASAAAQGAGSRSIEAAIRAHGPRLESLLGDGRALAFVQSAIAELERDERLASCTESSVLGSLTLAAQLGLEPSNALGYFYLAPQRIDGDLVCVPIVGYRGYIALAYASGKVSKIETFVVRDGDTFEHGANHIEGRFFRWEPKDYDARRPMTHVVALARIADADGVTLWASLTREQVEQRRPLGWENGPWALNADDMARKTAVRDLAPYLPMTRQLGRAIEVDERRIDQIPGIATPIVSDPPRAAPAPELEPAAADEPEE